MQSALFDMEPLPQKTQDQTQGQPSSELKKMADNDTGVVHQKEAPVHYQVLARKYRPSTFEDMIGQDVLVATMHNAVQAGRIAHAFIMTGIRGVGKTTTARILAKAVNCLGLDDTLTAPTTTPCGVCANCIAIASGRHPDVIEMDAASHTGVNDIREVTDNARYSPISARYKVYIIDEVHMLSNNAFNALLKTLEEPPTHAIFIFATTEIRKIPVTILSRCQRFDLKRVSIEDLAAHYKRILEKEGYQAETGAIRLIAAAASGSVRDGLSVLDQAIASSGNALLTEAMVRELLGIVDYRQVYELFKEVSYGNIGQALTLVEELYKNGADPVLLTQDLLEIVHRISRIKVAGINSVPQSTEQELAHAKELAESLPVSYLARTWQMLSRGYEEVRNAFNPLPAMEMVLIRIAHCSTMPALEDLVADDGVNTSNTDGSMSNTDSTPAKTSVPANPTLVTESIALKAEAQVADSTASSLPSSLPEIAKLCLDHNELVLYHQVMSEICPISVTPGYLQISLLPSAPKTLVASLGKFLEKATNTLWKIEVTTPDNLGVQPTLHQQEHMRIKNTQQEVREHPLVDSILKKIEDLEVGDIRVTPASSH